MKRYLLNTYCLVALYVATPILVLAQVGGGGQGGVGGGGQGGVGGGGQDGGSVSLQNPLGNQTLLGFFQDILDVLMVFAVPIIVLFIIYAGFKYVTAQGKPEEISTANRALLFAIVGGVLILGAQLLLYVISGTIEALG